jgi:hypothetical protein
MREIDGFFDGLFFSECVLGPALIQGRTVSVPVRGLFVLGRHPLASERAGPYEGELVFDGAVESRRKLTEYIGDSRKPDGFKPPREEVDALADADSGDEGLQEFGMEGYQESPSAWIDDWRIRARSFKLRVR